MYIIKFFVLIIEVINRELYIVYDKVHIMLELVQLNQFKYELLSII